MLMIDLLIAHRYIFFISALILDAGESKEL